MFLSLNLNILQLNAELKDSSFLILFGQKIFASQKGYKNDGIISIHPHNQEVLDYP